MTVKWSAVACFLVWMHGVSFPGAAWTAPPQRKKASPASKKSDPFLHSPRPLTFQEVLIAAGSVPPERLKQAIENRGVDFESSSENLARLEKAGTTREILDLIKRVARPPAPPPKPAPPPPMGSLVLNCSPPECNINLNGKPRGATKDGTLTLPRLPAGRVTVDFFKDGYLSQQRDATVEPAKPADISVRLEPDVHTREKFGAQLLAKTLEMLGGSTGLAEAASLIATGKLTLANEGAKATEWDLTARLKLPDLAYFEVKSGRNNAWLSLAGDDLKSNRKLDKFPQGAELEHALRLFRRFQAAAVINRIGKQKMQVVANDPRDHAFKAASGGEVYDLSLDADLVLTGLLYVSPNGPESGTQVTYADYLVRGKARYPATIRIKLSGGKSGPELHFDSVTLNPKLGNKDFRR